MVKVKDCTNIKKLRHDEKKLEQSKVYKNASPIKQLEYRIALRLRAVLGVD